MSGDKRVNVTQQSSVTVGDELLQGGEGEREQSGEGISSAMWEDSSKTWAEGLIYGKKNTFTSVEKDILFPARVGISRHLP